MECNRFVDYWETRRNWDIHTKKLQNMRPVMKTVNNYSPHKDRNKSVNQLYSHRSFEIQMQNKALLTKLTKQQAQRKHARKSEREPVIPMTSRNKKVKYFEDYEKENQNRDLLQKIKGVKTSYNVNRLVKDYRKKEKYMNLICKFPVRGLKPTKTLLKLQMITNRRMQSRSTEYFDQSYQKSRVKLNATSRIKTKNYDEQKKEQDKKPQKITKILKIKKISINETDIVVKGVQYESYLKLELQMDNVIKELRVEVSDLMKNYDNNYHKLCESLRYDHRYNQFYLQ